MKILTISDFIDARLAYGADFSRFLKIDLILSCGDLAPEYLAFIKDRLNAPLYYVRGNHDIRYEASPPRGCRDIDGRVIRFGGLRILGLEGSRWYNGKPIQYTDDRMRRKIRKLGLKLWWRGGIDIVISHAPPRGVHDAEDLCHRGFRSFLPVIRRYSPAYWIHGHIHKHFDEPAQRVTRYLNTRVINTCGYTILEIPGNRCHETF